MDKQLKLTPKRRRFIEVYLQTWNASEAARQAGFKHPGQQGESLLKILEIQTAIQERMQQLSMQTDEVLKRLTDQASLNAARFFDFELDEDGRLVMVGVNWELFQQFGHLVKKLSFNRRGQVILEFYDAQRALELIGKAQGMFDDREIDIDIHFNVEEWRAERKQRLEQLDDLEES